MKIEYSKPLDKLFFTSDPHFFHEAIIHFCKRPFTSVQDQTDQLIKRWNAVVPVDGDVFMLGDFAFTGQIDVISRLIERLNGNIWLVMGNHDYQNKLSRKAFVDMVGGRQSDVYTIKVKDDDFNFNIFCSHYPHLFWQRGAIHLHGHTHSRDDNTSNEVVPYHTLRYDVGVDNNDFFPISYYDLRDMFVERIKNDKLK